MRDTETNREGGFIYDVELFGGPFDGIQGWSDETPELLTIPVSRDAIDPDMSDTLGDAAGSNPTSLSIYSLEMQDGLLKYKYQYSVDAAEIDT